QLTTYTKTEVDTELAKKANISDMTVALAAKSDSTYVDAQLALKANQSTAYTKSETDTALGLKANVTDMTSALATKATIVYVDDWFALSPNDVSTSVLVYVVSWLLFRSN
ncbi:MAG: hypothetical protein ACKPKO_02570, partial [Candidatus Fonsibacter sp.]